MNPVTADMVLGFSNNVETYTIYAKQGDTERYITCELVDGLTSYVVEDTTYIFIKEKFSNGQIHLPVEVDKSGLSEDGTQLTIHLTSDMLSIPGIAQCEIVFMKTNSDDNSTSTFESGEYLTTQKFNINIEASVYSDGHFSSADQDAFGTLIPLLKEVERIEANFSEYEANEQTRIENEDIRVNNEIMRVDAESIRDENEEIRKSNENDRIEAEEGRSDAEIDRVNAESERAANEETRISNENTRIEAEETRASNESDRETSELLRESAETTRESNEETRQENESDRIAEESARANAESLRESNEETRESNEETRIESEESRAEAESVREENETTRQSNEETRLQNESNRQEAETSRISAEENRVAAEQSRETSEEARGTAETERIQNELSRVAAEAERSSAETTRIAQETIRGESETTRVGNENIRITSEDERIRAEQERIAHEGSGNFVSHEDISYDDVNGDSHTISYQDSRIGIAERLTALGHGGTYIDGSGDPQTLVNEYTNIAGETVTVDDASLDGMTVLAIGAMAKEMAEEALSDMAVTKEKSEIAVSSATNAQNSASQAAATLEEIKAITSGVVGTLRPKGTVAFENLPNTAVVGDMYNISNAFTTDERFLEGAGHDISLGANVYYTADDHWDILAGTSISEAKFKELYNGMVTFNEDDIHEGDVLSTGSFYFVVEEEV